MVQRQGFFSRRKGPCHQSMDLAYPTRRNGDNPNLCLHSTDVQLHSIQCGDVDFATTRPQRRSCPPPPHHPHPAIAMFTQSITTRAKAVKFAHQSLYNLKFSSLLKATQCEYLKGCPGIKKTLILKKLNPSPVTAKGHMKRPRHGIKSTRAKPLPPTIKVPQPIPQINVPLMPLGQEMRAYPGPAYGRKQDPR